MSLFSYLKYFNTKQLQYYCCYLIVFSPLTISAQLWSGNLGSPVYNYSFNPGTTQALPISKANTSYTYSQGCPYSGNYSIEGLLDGCDSGRWVSIIGDHTHDYGGNYMLVNAATKAGTVLVDTIAALCGNTTYQFSAWFANVMKNTACGGHPALPNFTLSIETTSGNVLASFTSGVLPITGIRNWIEYGVCYTTPAIPPTLVMRIKSLTEAGCGSVFVMDDVTLKPAGPKITITLDGQNVTNIDLCRGYTNPLILESAFTTEFSDLVLQWQYSIDTSKTWHDIPGATTAIYAIPHRDDSLIVYRIRIAERSEAGNLKCSIYSNPVSTNVHHLPEQQQLKEVIGCLNKNLALPAPPGFHAYQWTGPLGFISSTPAPVLKNIQSDNAGFYTVLSTGDFGCTVLDSLQVSVFPGTTIYTDTLYKICEGTPLHLSATGNGMYEWTPAKGLSNPVIANPVATLADSIKYKVVLTNSYGCKDSANVTINVFKKLVVSAGTDQSILLGDTVLLNGDVQGTSVTYSWASPGLISNSGDLQLVVSPPVDTHYTLNAVSTVGCGNSSSTVTVHVFKNIYMPKAFTPNADGLNDVYHVFMLDGYKLLSFTIFNRLGEKVFSTTNANTGWDGTIGAHLQDSGQYVYYLEMKHRSGKKITRKGTILLLR